MLSTALHPMARRFSPPPGSTPPEPMPEQQSPTELTGPQAESLLRELVALAGQEPALDMPPVLELLIGDILTRTSVEATGREPYLCVTGLLPPCAVAGPGRLDAGAGHELLWDAERGRHVVVRRIALRGLAGERGVMDQILETADLARRHARELAARH